MQHRQNSVPQSVCLRVYIKLDQAEAIEEFRIREHLPSLSEALRRLVGLGLETWRNDGPRGHPAPTAVGMDQR